MTWSPDRNVEARICRDPSTGRWTAACSLPIAIEVEESTYRRACGRLQRALEEHLGRPVWLREVVDFPPELDKRIATFKKRRAEHRRAEAALRAEARRLAMEIKPLHLAMTHIARHLGLTSSELASLRVTKPSATSIASSYDDRQSRLAEQHAMAGG